MKMMSTNLLKKIAKNNICYDTRKLVSGDTFVCLKGANFDSHSKIHEIIEKAAYVVVEDGNKYIDFDSDKLIKVTDTREALALISKEHFMSPTDKLKVIGITGTKGKTTTAFMVKKILEDAGHKVGMIGTVGVFFGDNFMETPNTTPESFVIYSYAKKMLDEGCDYLVMEVSSQALKYHRVTGINFDYAMWTNIAPEHIGDNEHTDYNDYLNSKLKIFSMAKTAIVNDDSNDYDKILDATKDIKLVKKVRGIEFNLTMPGDYNKENASLAYTLGLELGINENLVINSIENTVVPGRCEVVYKNDEYTIVVDFAHEKNGAKSFLETMKKENPKRLVVVFGCGGNRAKERRYGMGEVAGKYADFVILTADNSRKEKTIDIIADIETTLSKYKKKDIDYVIREDRREAIKYAIENHKVGDLICVIGKGHETHMDTNGKLERFLDSEEILKIING